MSTARQHREEPKNPIHKEVKAIADQLDQLASAIQAQGPSRKDVEACASKLMDLINKYHQEIAKHEFLLKNAIIDLTEIPEMKPQMQKVAFEVAIKDAKKNLDSFLSKF